MYRNITLHTLIALIVNVFLLSCGGVATHVSCAVGSRIEEVPSEKEGKFSFKITYEYQGKVTELEDIGTCTYLGSKCDGRGMHNNWQFTLNSGTDKLRPININTDLKLYFTTGGCQNLMTQSFDPIHARISVDPHTGPAEEWRPIETQEEIDSLEIKIVDYELVRLH